MKKLLNFCINVFARFWALWGIVSFVATFLLIFIPSMITYLIPEPKGQAIFIRISKIWMNIWLTLIACPVRIRGKQNVEQGSTYVFTCNHNTFLDVPLTCPYIPGANKTIAKKEFTKIPLFGWFYAKGSILVDRKDEGSRRTSFEAMKRTLKNKMHVCIYPEGTRNRTAEPLKKFYDGAFKLAVDTQTPVIPTILFNTGKALPINKLFYLVPKKLEMHFLPAISPAGYTVEELRNKVFETMKEYYVANDGTI